MPLESKIFENIVSSLELGKAANKIEGQARVLELKSLLLYLLSNKSVEKYV